MIGYYDLVLGLVPVSLLGITGALHTVGFDLTVAVPLAAVAAAAIIGHGLFVNAPVEEPSARDAPTLAAD